jgi:hypothetical protein
VHGLLGQTHRASSPVPGAEQGEGVIEVRLFAVGLSQLQFAQGTIEDYVVADIWGTNFKFNQVILRCIPASCGSLSRLRQPQFTRSEGLLSKAECAALLASPKFAKPLPGSAAGGL